MTNSKDPSFPRLGPVDQASSDPSDQKQQEPSESCQRCGESFSGDDIEECLFSLHQLTLCEYCVGEMSQN